jgi:hypothetical protein
MLMHSEDQNQHTSFLSLISDAEEASSRREDERFFFPSLLALFVSRDEKADCSSVALARGIITRLHITHAPSISFLHANKSSSQVPWTRFRFSSGA